MSRRIGWLGLVLAAVVLAAWLGELDVCVNERAEKSLRREIFRRVHAILVKIQQ